MNSANRHFESADVLSDADTRRLYNELGMSFNDSPGSASKRGSARDAWEEFKPFVRQNKHTRARASSHSQSTSQPDAAQMESPSLDAQER